MEEKAQELEPVRLTVVKALSLRHRVEKCVYSTDGKRLVACLGDFSVKIYDVVDRACDKESATHADEQPSNPAPFSSPTSTLRTLCILRGHSSNVWSIHFSQDTLLLCSSSSDKTVKIWNLETEESVFTFTQHTDIVWCCSFVPCHTSLVASGSSDKTVKIWDYITGSILYDLKQYYSAAVEALSFSRDGTKLCTGSQDGRIILWRNMFPKGAEAPNKLVLYQANDWIRFVCFSEHDSNLLVSDGGSNTVLVWDLSDVTDNLAADQASDCGIKKVRFAETPDSTGMDSEVSSLKPKVELKGHLNTVWDACIVPDSNNRVNIVITCSGDRSLRSVCSLLIDVTIISSYGSVCDCMCVCTADSGI